MSEQRMAEYGGDERHCEPKDEVVGIHTHPSPEPQREPPYPWCVQPNVCRGYCPRDPNCGE